MRVLDADRHVGPALGAREPQRGLRRVRLALGRGEVGPAPERLAHQRLGVRPCRRQSQLADRHDVGGVDPEQRQQLGHGRAALDLGVGQLVLEAALLERDLVEFRHRDVARVRPLAADAHRLLVPAEVVVGEAQSLGGDQHAHEPRAHLERQAAIEIGALRPRRCEMTMRRREALAALAPEDKRLADPDLLIHRVAHSEAGRVRPADRKVAGAERQPRVRIEARGRDVATGSAHLEGAHEDLRVLPAKEPDSVIQRHADRLFSGGRSRDGNERENRGQHENEPLHCAACRYPR